jgi:hypothetical protein
MQAPGHRHRPASTGIDRHRPASTGIDRHRAGIPASRHQGERA